MGSTKTSIDSCFNSSELFMRKLCGPTIGGGELWLVRDWWDSKASGMGEETRGLGETEPIARGRGRFSDIIIISN